MKLELLQKEKVSLEEIKKSHIPIEEKTFVSIGGGIGSFCFVDSLRIHGVDGSQISVIGQTNLPYQQLKTYCDNSTLYPDQRLRSDSGARPDNFWGFPGYALSEIAMEIKKGHLIHAGKILWQITTEPVLADFYTPRLSLVYASIQKEMKRIRWHEMLRNGEAFAIRKVVDGRYAIFFKVDHKVKTIIAPFIHFSLGHTLRQRDYTRDISEKINKNIVSVYRLDNRFFMELRKRGGSVLVDGRGIAAARIIEQLLQIQSKNVPVEIISLFTSPVEKDADYRGVKRDVFLGWRLQYFNWPRSTFGGNLMEKFKKLDDKERKKLASFWGAATTPPRKKWKKLISYAFQQGHYKQIFGKIEQVQEVNSRLVIQLKDKSESITVDFIIDCRGFEDKVEYYPLYKDMIEKYDIVVSEKGRFRVSEFFELEELASFQGGVFVSGCCVAGSLYGPVDSFLGHQYASIKIIERITRIRKEMIKPLDLLTSTVGWIKWVFNISL